jgi:hypothetical protein
MKVAVPWREATYPQFQFTIRTPAGENTLTVDDSHREVDIPIPTGVDEDDVEIIGCYMGRDGRPVSGCDAVLVKAAVEKPALEPVVPSAVEPESEPVAEPKPETEYPRRRRMSASVGPEATNDT